MDIVEISNLSIKDRNKVLVNKVSLNIKEREIFGLVGESGSGKTLTAKSIINLLPDNLSYTADELKVADKSIISISSKEKKELIGKNVGFIPQNTIFYLHPMIKIKNQIGDGYIYHMNKGKKEALEKAEFLLHKVGFDSPKKILNYYPWQLSGGMRQRVNIAMALMNDPKFIIGDEPTTALDSTIQRQVMDLFREIRDDLGISILLISHDLALIKQYSDRMAVMYAGQIVESGIVSEIFNASRHTYTKMLIKAIPSLNMKKEMPLQEIKGFVQEEGRDRDSCIFIDRCPDVLDICSKEVRESKIDNDHYYKCNIE